MGPPSVLTARPCRNRSSRLRPWAWRLVVVAALVMVVRGTLARLLVVRITVFVAVILTALLDPTTGLLAKRLGRTIGSGIALLGALGVIGGIGHLVRSSPPLVRAATA